MEVARRGLVPSPVGEVASGQPPARADRPTLVPVSTPGEEPKPLTTPPDDRDDLRVALEVMKSLADQEYDRGERLTTKARQAFAFVAVLLAGVQTAALSALTASGVTGGQQRGILILAATAVALAAVTGLCALRADVPRSFANLGSQDVLDSVNKSLEAGQPVAGDLTELYARVVDERREAVRARKSSLGYAQAGASATVVVLAVELLYALHTRLP